MRVLQRAGSIVHLMRDASKNSPWANKREMKFSVCKRSFSHRQGRVKGGRGLGYISLPPPHCPIPAPQLHAIICIYFLEKLIQQREFPLLPSTMNFQESLKKLRVSFLSREESSLSPDLNPPVSSSISLASLILLEWFISHPCCLDEFPYLINTFCLPHPTI